MNRFHHSGNQHSKRATSNQPQEQPPKFTYHRRHHRIAPSCAIFFPQKESPFTQFSNSLSRKITLPETEHV